MKAFGDDTSDTSLEKKVQEKLSEILKDAALVEDAHTMENLIGLMEAVAMSDEEVQAGKFNPVLLLGETAGGKSSLAKYLAAGILGQGYTRIQINERTDELDLFGSYEPRRWRSGWMMRSALFKMPWKRTSGSRSRRP
jgi:MoxR-like ATPase